MELLLDFILTITSLLFLIKASGWMLKGAIDLARIAKLSPLVIGSTIVAFGTALPTIAVNIAILFSNESAVDIAIGNMIGTNYVNLGLALGIPAFITTIVTKYNVFEKEIPLYLGLTALLTSFASNGDLTRIEGIFIFLSYLVISLIIYQYARRERSDGGSNKEFSINEKFHNEVLMPNLGKSLMSIAAGLVILVIASFVLTYAAPDLSERIGVDQYIVGLTFIGIGTSLPTIVASIQSAKKGYLDIVLGNVFGGSIINIGLGIGLPAVFKKLIINSEGLEDIYFTNIYNLIILLAVLIELKLLGQNKALSRVSGIIIVMVYFLYIGGKIIKTL